jgi:hypothetical protein
MGTTLPVDTYRIERDPSELLPTNMFCMDDRIVALTGWQHAGGPDGYARDYATAREMRQPNSIVDQRQSVSRLTPLTATALGQSLVVAFMHPSCAAEQEAETVVQRTFQDPAAVYQRVEAMGFDITEPEFEQIIDANARLALLEAEVGSGPNQEAMLTVPIKPGEHAANDIVIDHEGKTYWDGMAANEAGHPAYYIGSGLLETVHRRVNARLPHEVDPRAMLVASAVRHAAISLILPQPAGHELNLHVIQ